MERYRTFTADRFGAPNGQTQCGDGQATVVGNQKSGPVGLLKGFLGCLGVNEATGMYVVHGSTRHDFKQSRFYISELR